METKNNPSSPSIEQIKAAYAAAQSDESKNILRALYGDLVEEQDNRPITERVKTLEDAISVLGGNHPYVRHLTLYEQEFHGNEEFMADLLAYYQLRIICAALNEGWTPDWADTDEYKYYPWFTIYTAEEIEEMDEEQKSRVVGRANNYANAYGGLVYSIAYYVSSVSFTFSGSRLAFKSRELAEYAGKQFGEIYADFLI